jgi:RNA-directed DNA polymerase
MSDCLTATNGVNNVRKLQRARYRPSKQDKKNRLYSLYDKVWRADVLWEAWRQGKANKGAPGVDGLALEPMVTAGQAEERITKL